MSGKSRPRFVTLFIGGFALGAASMVGLHAAHADASAMPSLTQVASR